VADTLQHIESGGVGVTDPVRLTGLVLQRFRLLGGLRSAMGWVTGCLVLWVLVLLATPAVSEKSVL
jgi:hypothetical protein